MLSFLTIEFSSCVQKMVYTSNLSSEVTAMQLLIKILINVIDLTKNTHTYIMYPDWANYANKYGMHLIYKKNVY